MKLDITKRKKRTTCESQFHGYQHVENPVLTYDQITDSEGLQREYKQGDYYIHEEPC